MKKQPLKQHFYHGYLIGTGTASSATRICFNPFCWMGLTMGSLSSDSVSCVVVFFSFFFCLSLNIFILSYWFGKLKPEGNDR